MLSPHPVALIDSLIGCRCNEAWQEYGLAGHVEAESYILSQVDSIISDRVLSAEACHIRPLSYVQTLTVPIRLGTFS